MRVEMCDGCGCLEIERPVNRYDCWRALCCDPDKPAWLGARRTAATAPACSERGPVGIRRPKWCGGKRPLPSPGLRETPGDTSLGGGGKKKAATVAETP